MVKAVYPGSFDPITLGHVDIIKRVSPLFDELTVLVANSSAKNYMFSTEERVDLISRTLDGLDNVKVDLHDGLTVDYVQEKSANVIIRGIRAVSDFEYELVMANMNKKLNKGIETMVVFASPEYHFVTSRIMKEVAAHDGRLEGLLPEVVIEALQKKLNK